MATKLQIRRDTAANWTSANPTLSAGEFGFETNTRKLKLGDGSTAWNSLAYFADELAGGVDSAGIISLLGNGSVQHIIPAGNELYDLGSSSNRFRDLYLSGNTLNLGGVTLSVDSGGTLTLPEGTKVGTIRVLDSADVAVIAGGLSGLDSTGVQNVINAAYIQANQITYNTSDFVDSAFVTAQINNLIDGAPGTLDTLNEIAAALNDDAAAYDTLLSLINAKTDYDSADTLGLIDSAYIQARQITAPSGVDSAAVTALIDSAYVQARQTSGGSGTVDSAQVISIINNNTNSGFVWYSYTATQGQTTFQDSDNSGQVLSYDPNGIAVFYNGVLLTPNDFTASDRSSVVLGTATDSGENIAIFKWGVGYVAPNAWYGDRAVIGGGMSGSAPTMYSEIDYYDITTPGNAANFGHLIRDKRGSAMVSDTSTALQGGGSYYNGAAYVDLNEIDYFIISTTGNASDFGDLTTARTDATGMSDATYGVFSGGTSTNVIDYVIIASPGNASDFGDLTQNKSYTAATNDATTGLIMGGYVSNSISDIDYITIASPGNASDFGDLNTAGAWGSACSSTTRGVFAGGRNYDGGSNPWLNNIQYITIATPGNATDAGDLTQPRYQMAAASNGTYATFNGGYENTLYNIIDYITIASTSNATDFGDLTATKYLAAGTSGNAS